MKGEKRVLPADAYDALELSALAFGGIGAGKFTSDGVGDGDGPTDIPVCAIGHAQACDARPAGPTRIALWCANVLASDSDRAVRAINKRLGKPSEARVAFEEWCRKLNVVRGA